jgi:3-phenylpropionate/trans-cinnamate dioxygenase ferredoxin reductase component
MSAGTLIIGASQAGLQLAVTLRELGYDAPVRLVGDEAVGPYQRPPLSKAFLAGDADADSLQLRNAGFYAERKIELICGTRIGRVSMSAGGGTASAGDGREFTFTSLALTTGAEPRRLPVPGADLGRVLYLRDLGDAAALRSLLPTASDIVVIGGGFIGLEAAAVARSYVPRVTVVEALDTLMSRVTAPVIGEFFLHAHGRRGTRFRLGSGVVRLHGTAGDVSGVELADGSVVPADLVLVGIGVIPRTELAEQLGATCRNGIVVNRHARTTVPGVVAAGDCAVGPDPLGASGGLVRLESVQNAVDQAKAAAASIVGQPQPYQSVPWFWSDQADLKLHMAGLSRPTDEVVLRGDPDAEKFSVLYYRDGRFVAIHSVNRPLDYMAARTALGQRADIPAQLAADPGVPLKSIVVARSEVG